MSPSTAVNRINDAFFACQMLNVLCWEPEAFEVCRLNFPVAVVPNTANLGSATRRAKRVRCILETVLARIYAFAMCGGLHPPPASAESSPPFHILAVSLKVACNLRKVQVLTVLSLSVAVMLSRSLGRDEGHRLWIAVCGATRSSCRSQAGPHHRGPRVTAVTQDG